MRLRHHEIDNKSNDPCRDREIDRMPRGQKNWRAAHVAVELRESNERASKGDGADRHAKAHLYEALAANDALRSNSIGFRAVHCGGRDENGGETDQAVKC